MSFDPIIQDMLTRMAEFANGPRLTADEIVGRRAAFNQMAVEGARAARPDVEIHNSVVDGIPVRVYRPIGVSARLPVHVYFHGGAFILGTALSSAQDADLAERASAAQCVVVSVEYRLAPEHRFPAGIEDCYRALTQLVANAEGFGIDPDVVTVGGASSGGNFAAVVALLAKERGGPRLALQLLEIAGTDLTKSTTAWRYPAEGHDTTRESDLYLIDMYLNSVAERADIHASPLFYPDLAGVAPAYIMNAEFDPRRDECEAYGARLSDAGVPVTVRMLEGHIHGSMSLPDWPPAVAWREEANRALKDAHARSSK